MKQMPTSLKDAPQRALATAMDAITCSVLKELLVTFRIFQDFKTLRTNKKSISYLFLSLDFGDGHNFDLPDFI